MHLELSKTFRLIAILSDVFTTGWNINCTQLILPSIALTKTEQYNTYSIQKRKACSRTNFLSTVIVKGLG